MKFLYASMLCAFTACVSPGSLDDDPLEVPIDWGTDNAPPDAAPDGAPQPDRGTDLPPPLFDAGVPDIAVEPPPMDPQAFDRAWTHLEQRSQALTQAGVMGVGYALLVGDRLQSGGAGTTHEGGTPVDGDTPFAVASISKVITALLAQQLIERGQLQWDSSPLTLTPNIQFGRTAEGRAIHVREMLSHTAGLPTYLSWFGPNDENFPDFAGPGSLTQAMESAPPMQIWAPPSAVYRYSNPSYSLLGLMVETAAGTPFAQLAQNQVFDPLGMAHTTYNTAPNAAWGHYSDGFAGTFSMGDIKFYEPMASMLSSAHDLGTLAQAIMHTQDGVVSPAIRSQLLTPVFNKREGFQTAMSLGLHVSAHGGVTLVEHSGAIGGFQAFWTLVPELDLAVVTLVNSDSSPDAYAIPTTTIESYLDIATPPEPADNAGTLNSAAGRYRATTFGEVTLSIVPDGGLLTFSNGVTTALYPGYDSSWYFEIPANVPNVPVIYSEYWTSLVIFPDANGQPSYLVSDIGVAHRMP